MSAKTHVDITNMSGNGGQGGEDFNIYSSDESISVEKTEEGYDLKSEKVEIYSSDNTISSEKTEEGWDLKVKGDDVLRIYVKTFKEFMEAMVVVGTKYVQGDTTNFVVQLLDDIDLTSPTSDDENLYKVNNNKLIDRTNKTYNFRTYLRYTTIYCDGKKRILQTIYPDSGYLDTWTITADWVKYENVNVGGNITKYDNMHGTYTPSNTPPQFSRFLLKSNGNPDVKLYDCQITCCGANQDDPDSYNPLFTIGTDSGHVSDNRGVGLYHSRFELINCNFFHGTDSTNSMWGHLNAPIVIQNFYDKDYQRVLVVKQLSKSINHTNKETSVPNIQLRSPVHTYKNAWQVETDGTCLVSHQQGEDYILLKSRLSSNDYYIQGDPDMQPAGATNTYNWVSVSEELKARQKTDNKLTQAEIEGIISSGVGAHSGKYLDGIGLETIARKMTNSNYLYCFGNTISGFTLSQTEVANYIDKTLRGDNVIPILMWLDASYNPLCTFIPTNMFFASQTSFKIIYQSYYPNMIGRMEVTASLSGSTSTIEFIQ